MEQTFTVTIKHKDAFEALQQLGFAIQNLNPVKIEHKDFPVELHLFWD